MMNTKNNFFSLFSVRFVALLFLLLILTRAFYYWRSDGFSLIRISYVPEKTNNELAMPSLKKQKELSKICSHHFTYLGKGSQAYAFISKDRQYVLKLFKYYHLKPIPWMDSLPLFYPLNEVLNERLDRRYKKAAHTLNSYKIANNLIPDECGLIFMQITPSESFTLPVTITDKIKRTYQIDLSKHGFMLQKRVNLVLPTLEKWIKKGEIHKAKKFIRSLLEIIITRSLKGVQDQDPDVYKNAGVFDTQAFFIDVGGFHINDHAKQQVVYANDIRKITLKLTQWLKPRSPELVQFLDDEIASVTKQDNNYCLK